MPEILCDEIPSLDLINFTDRDAEKKKKFVAGLSAAHYRTDSQSSKLLFDLTERL